MSEALALPHESAACLNCGAILNGPFCHACGQRDIPPYPSTRELVVDAFWELSGWDGRFVKTVRALVERPGSLTVDFLEGRRASFLSPLRLYLLASLVYFVLASWVPSTLISTGNEDATGGIDITRPTGPKPESRPERVTISARKALEHPDSVTADQRARALKDIEHAPALVRPFLSRAIGDPKGFKRGVLEAMPKMLFVLLPIFAFFVSLFYRGRKYPEHLYFAIHLQAFVFLSLCILELAKLTRIAALVGVFALISFLWIPAYSTIAFRRVYGGSIGKTLAKEAGIGILYGITSIIALLVTIYLVSIMK